MFVAKLICMLSYLGRYAAATTTVLRDGGSNSPRSFTVTNMAERAVVVEKFSEQSLIDIHIDMCRECKYSKDNVSSVSRRFLFSDLFRALVVLFKYPMADWRMLIRSTVAFGLARDFHSLAQVNDSIVIREGVSPIQRAVILAARQFSVNSTIIFDQPFVRTTSSPPSFVNEVAAFGALSSVAVRVRSRSVSSLMITKAERKFGIG